MKKKNVNTNLVVFLLVMVGLLGYVLLAQAGNLQPSAAPTPTMKTLQEIYDAASGGINEREGFCQYFETPGDSNEVILTVPEGQRFVLLKLYCLCDIGEDWSLTVDGSLLINGKSIIEVGYQTHNVDGIIYKFMHDFPDRCVVVNAGQTLEVVNSHPNPSFKSKTTIIGYYYDVP